MTNTCVIQTNVMHRQERFEQFFPEFTRNCELNSKMNMKQATHHATEVTNKNTEASSLLQIERFFSIIRSTYSNVCCDEIANFSYLSCVKHCHQHICFSLPLLTLFEIQA